MASSFVSVFKINGVPILPPVITLEVKNELVQYRQKAIEIEQRIRESKNIEVKKVVSSDFDTPNVTASLTRSQSFTLEAPSPGLVNLPDSTIHHLPELSSPKSLQQDPREQTSPLGRLIRSNSFTLDNPSPLLIKHLQNENLYLEQNCGVDKNHVKRLDFSVDEKSTKNKKSDTKCNGKPKWVATKKVSPKPVSPLRKQKSPYGSFSVTPKPWLAARIRQKTPSKKEPSTVKPGFSTKSENNPMSPSVDDCHKRIQAMQTEHENRMKDLLKRQEEEQRQLQESFRRQQEELMQMLPTPDVDQIHTSTPLLTSPNESLVGTDNAQNILSFRKLNISSKDFVNRSESQSSISHLSSSQTLFIPSDSSRTSADFDESTELYKTCNNYSSDNKTNEEVHENYNFKSIRNYLESINSNVEDKDLKKLSHLETTQRNYDQKSCPLNNAATIINAHVRGYLTRRLFQTDRVQKIVQVIRDTLLFILDMHHERAISRQHIHSPADVQLKRTLLHQLSSACYQLHDIFFETSTVERMEIIRKDREFLKRRLIDRPRTGGSASSIKSQRTAHIVGYGKPTILRKLQTCALYSVNIEGKASEEPSNEDEINSTDVVKSTKDASFSLITPSSKISAKSSPYSPVSSINRSKKASTKSLNISANWQSKSEIVRPKTSDPQLTGVPYRKPVWDQRHF
ncbi:centriolar coiled-coil protein of 110 kDa [Uranotaenia lowii]|uniref:centriolar coiled-coil protein of 110 kDa n=1 Tax=Uranotaenia lowii TaxID=190385 RepID=UPI002479945C|nr:centriolar coiled-coil protein of 110 kDa [Uranotaenia lowii]